ncbi:MAG: hypothetical protein DID92_2727745754 [Candidatus Nitrotoga sp. SPKER]|nr:MAG: hypothetical protein DID92_2727745754 [Candidatus Nitrotoga sp. SPKER]
MPGRVSNSDESYSYGFDGHLQSILSLSSFPALKCGTYLAGTNTLLPVFGLRPVRNGL